MWFFLGQSAFLRTQRHSMRTYPVTDSATDDESARPNTLHLIQRSNVRFCRCVFKLLPLHYMVFNTNWVQLTRKQWPPPHFCCVWWVRWVSAPFAVYEKRNGFCCPIRPAKNGSLFASLFLVIRALFEIAARHAMPIAKWMGRSNEEASCGGHCFHVAWAAVSIQTDPTQHQTNAPHNSISSVSKQMKWKWVGNGFLGKHETSQLTGVKKSEPKKRKWKRACWQRAKRVAIARQHIE